MGVFYAREPYLNADSNHVTRFLGLAEVGNKNKQVCSSMIPVTRAWYLIIFVYGFWFLAVWSLASWFFLIQLSIAIKVVLLTVCMAPPKIEILWMHDLRKNINHISNGSFVRFLQSCFLTIMQNSFTPFFPLCRNFFMHFLLHQHRSCHHQNLVQGLQTLHYVLIIYKRELLTRRRGQTKVPLIHNIGGMMSQSGKRMDLKGKSSVSNLYAQGPVLVGKIAISNTTLKQENSVVEVFVLILSSKVSVKKAQSAATSMSFKMKVYKGNPDLKMLTGIYWFNFWPFFLQNRCQFDQEIVIVVSKLESSGQENAGFVYQARVWSHIWSSV